MRIFIYPFLILMLLSCKRKTFADEISLDFPKDVKMKIQDFNEGVDDFGTNIIYLGKFEPKIEVKYYYTSVEFPPPPPIVKSSYEDYLRKTQKFFDSIGQKKNSFFNYESIEIKESLKVPMIDSINNKNLEIIVKEKDTIPIYKKDFYSDSLKTYKGFPVFIKNVSKKTVNIPSVDELPLSILDKKEWFYFRNNNWMICGTGRGIIRYFDLKPNEIVVFALPFFKGGEKRQFRVKIDDAHSKEFELSIDKKIIKSQESWIKDE